MNITINHATFVIHPTPSNEDNAMRSALQDAILGTMTEGSDGECFFGNCDDEEDGTTGDTEHTPISAVQSVLDAFDTANRLKQLDKHTTNDFWLLADTIKAQYEHDTIFSFALLQAVDLGAMLQKTSKFGNPLYKAA